jgi:hypothetical protein
LAVARNGKLVFVVDPKSSSHPSCLRQVEVIAEGGTKAHAQAGDDKTRVGYGTFWFQSVGYDDGCANRFPLTYGTKLGGEQTDEGVVSAKPLVPGVVYTVGTTTGATGYGGGRFVIQSDGRIENLPPSTANNMLENAN